MVNTLHITSGDIAGKSLGKSGLSGEVFVWHDVMYDGPRNPGWPDDGALRTRARYLEGVTGGGMSRGDIQKELEDQYHRLAAADDYGQIVLWFDACLFDQSMLAHILECLRQQHIRDVELLCVDTCPGITPYHGLGQLSPSQLASVYDQRRPVTEEQFQFAKVVDKAFAHQNLKLFSQLAQENDAPLPWIPAAVSRWLQEQPNPETGLGRLEQLALVKAGITSLKIEGRMKGIHYLATVLKVYREAIDTYIKSPDTYISDPAWFKELSKISHRGYCTGFYLEDPNQAASNMNGAIVSGQPFLAKVLSVSSNGAAQIDVRNRIRKQDRIEILSAHKPLQTDTITQIYNLDQAEVDVAHPGTRAIISLNTIVSPNDMIRKVDL